MNNMEKTVADTSQPYNVLCKEKKKYWNHHDMYFDVKIPSICGK